MSKHAEAIRGMAEQHLEPGEHVIESMLVNYNGTVPPVSLPGGGDRSADPDASIRFPSARQMALALTPHRLLVWSVGFSGKPKDFIGQVPITAIERLEVAEARLGGILRLTLRSGARVDVEALRGEPGDGFAAALGSLVPPADGGAG